MTRGLLTCNACGSDVYVMGKKGAFFLTHCSSCGMTSQPMVTSFMTQVEVEHRAANEVSVEVVKVPRSREFRRPRAAY